MSGRGKFADWPLSKRRYLLVFWPLMTLYVLSVVLISWVLPISHLPDGPRQVLALTPVLPIGGVIWAMARRLEETEDEFQRLLDARAMLLATGVLLVGATAWGFLQVYARLAPFPTIILFPVWCGMWALTSLLVRWRHR
jgi:hypothetical protein